MNDKSAGQERPGSPSTRRDLLKMAGAAGFSLLLPRTGRAQTASQAPRIQPGAKRGGTLRVAVPRWPGYGLLVRNNHWIGWYLNQYESLLKVDDKENYYPWLAESWKVSDDGLSYEFKLRKDVYFQDGLPLSAPAVKASFDKLLTRGFTNTNDPFSLGMGNLKAIEAIDDLNLRFVLSAPNALFLNTLSTAVGAVISPKSLTKETVSQGGLVIKGTGPFDLVSVIPEQQLVFKRYERYNWAPRTALHDGPAYLDQIVLNIVPDPAVRSGLLTSGQVDIITDLSIDDIPLFKGSDQYRYFERYGTRAPFIYYFNTRGFATDDIRVRDAFREALDVDALVDAVYRGAGRRAWSDISASSRFYNPKFEHTYSNNIARANKLLDDAGWTRRNSDGVRVNARGQALELVLLDRGFEGSTRLLTEAIQQALLQNAGIKLSVDSVEIAQGFAKREQNRYSVFHNTVSGTDPGHGINISWLTTGSVNFSQTHDDVLQAEVKGQGESLTAAERQKHFDALEQRILLDEKYALPLVQRAETIATLPRVRNAETSFVPQRGDPGPFAYDIWLDA